MTRLPREERHWNALAKTDPMWVILTEPGKEGRWDADAFFASGRREITDALGLLRERFGLQPRAGTALDFGCGLGRLTQALAEHFGQVHGVDISSEMIAQANAHNRHGQRVTYHANPEDSLPMLADESVDFVYSRLVLQHIPRAGIERYVAEFARVLAPGGIAMFQLMTRARPWHVRLRHLIRNAAPDVYRRVRDALSGRARWEMNVVPAARVRLVLEQHGITRIEELEEASGGTVFESRMFVAVKG